jgi:hypothetical protein
MVSTTDFSHPPEDNNVSNIVKDRHQFWIPVPYLKDRYALEKPAGVRGSPP